MGGFLLESPDFPVIPIDARQIHYLVERGYLAFPDVCRQTIWDKNKADRFTRAITVLQTLWFGLQCLVRRAQNLPISTFELSTLAFVFCTIPTSFFWYFKPLDVEAPIILRTNTRIADILIDAGDAVNKRYTQTPLDFINPPSQASLLTAFFFSLQCVGISGSQKSRPVKAFPNSKMTPPQDLSAKAAALAPIIGLGYTAIHLIGWNYPFPTFIEQTFWRVASSLLIGLVSIYLVFLAIGKAVAATLARRLYNADASTSLEFLALCPWLIQMLLFVPAIATYSLARLYIIVEGFVSLRALPLGVYVTSDWLDFIPHF
ncbi:MAG: hypothetical protein M1839_003526 [Geoglossum umbratile]|nr:MAG: hypothetical protein M1839_003526 [Geoglossum umbratile]